jgi:uncharacterized protein
VSRCSVSWTSRPAIDLHVVELSGGAIALVATAVACGALAQSVTGFGFSLVAAPVFVIVTTPTNGVRLVNLLALVVNVGLLTVERRTAMPGDALRLLLPALVVAPVVASLAHRADSDVLSIVAGSLIVTTALVLASGVRSRRLHGVAGAIGAGSVSSAMNVVSGVGGPAAAMYAVNAHWPPHAMRPTLQLYFLGLNIVSLAALGLVVPEPAAAGVLLAALVAGLLLGLRLARRLPVHAVRITVLALAIVGGTVAILRGLV